MDYKKKSLELHEQHKGKLEVRSKVGVKTREDLSAAYTPGVAEPCLRIAENKKEAYRYTAKGNMVAVVTDGTAVLGLGDIGPEAALPVMEGKAILFKEFGNVDAFPICLATKDTEEIIQTVKNIAPGFGGINLEDISAPRCFEIESRLKQELSIPVFHDDQHGTAIALCAALINASRFTGRPMAELKAVISGAGAAGMAIAKLLLRFGLKNIVVLDRKGAIAKGDEGLTAAKQELAEITNPQEERGSLADVIKGKDVFIGVSAPNILTAEMVRSMAKEPMIFAMSNPVPEIMPEEAKAGGAAIIATGRSDYPNQINNVLVFPGIFRGALDAGAKEITEDMKLAAAWSIADLIKAEELTAEYLIPDPFDQRVVPAVAEAVKKAVQA